MKEDKTRVKDLETRVKDLESIIRKLLLNGGDMGALTIGEYELLLYLAKKVKGSIR